MASGSTSSFGKKLEISGEREIDPETLKGRIVPREFYSDDTLLVARRLLGKVIGVKCDSDWTLGRIVETEAYQGDDPASHSCRGLTPRTAPMFAAGGIAYVYFIYGNYEMLNFVTEREGYPGAALIRAVEPLAGLKLMEDRRKGAPRSNWTNGPGKLCRALGIRMSHNAQPLQGPELHVFDDGFSPAEIMSSPRVGISAGQDRYWRFFSADNSFVSKAPQNKQARREHVG